jgi:CheY-like chemotaxis protein
MTEPLAVLYAEDDPNNRLLLQRYLGSLGLEVDLAENGRQAVEKCRDRLYHLILLDVHMPKLKGDQVLKQARDLQPRARFVAVTSDDALLDYLLETGFDAVRIKPVPLDAYGRLLEELNLSAG